MGSKKYKIIAAVSSGVVATAILATVVPIAVIKAQSHHGDDPKPVDAKVEIAPKQAFEWDSEEKIIKGFKAGVDIKSLIKNNQLGIPECEGIDEQAFSFAFENIDTSFGLYFVSSTRTIGANAFFGNDKINAFGFIDNEGNVVKTGSLTSIGKCAFEKTGVTKIVLPETCNEIGERAFYGCKSLATIDLAGRTNMLKNIGSHAFQDLASTGDCRLVVSEKMRPETASAIAANLSTHEWGGLDFNTWKIYVGSTLLTKPNKTIPTIYLNIDENYKLKAGVKCGVISDYDALYVPQEVKEIDGYAFANNTKLTSLVFENNSQCTNIGVRSFYNCTNLCKAHATKDLTMPDALTSIGWQAFDSCSEVRKLDFSKIAYDNRSRSFAVGTEAFRNWYFDSTFAPGKYIGPTVKEGAQTPEEVETIFKFALSVTGQLNESWIILDTNPMTEEWYESHMTQKTIPVKGDVGYEYHLVAFDWTGIEQEGFNTLTIAGDTEYIESTAFWDEETQTSKIPETIKTVNMSKSHVKEIRANAFRQSNIQTVIFSDETTTIGENAFQDCKKLNGISIPPLIEEIGANAFKGCDNAYYLDLSKLTNKKLKEIITAQNEGEDVIGENAFKDFGILQQAGGTIIWSDDVDEEVKNGIINILVGAGLPESWVKEDTGDSGYTGGIPEKYNKNSILIITHDEVYDKFVLEGINWSVLDEYIRDIEERTGVEVDSLPLIIPSHVTEIANNFWGSPSSSYLSKIDRLLFANNSKCTTIGASAFKNATNFKGDLLLPTGIKTIGANAFAGCTGFDGTLSLPNTISVAPAGISATAFADVTTFITLNISSWDNDYVNTWDAARYKTPLAPSTLQQFSKYTFVQTNDQISATNFAQIKTSLFNIAKLPSETLGNEISSYASQIPAMDITSELEKDPSFKYVDTEAKKKLLAEKYIDLINTGATIGGKDYTGEEILTNDLMLTFKNAAVNSPTLASTSPSINVRLSHVDISGQSISFDIVANINVYSDTYKYGYVSQFATHVDSLKIVSADQYPSSDITQEANQIGIVFTTNEYTSFQTSYDKQYLYGVGEDGSIFKKNAIDVTNKSFDFRNLDGVFNRNEWIDGQKSPGAKLHDAARQAFFAAPSLFGLMLGAYDYGALYTLNNGCDENGYLYSPYVESKVEDEHLQFKYTPLVGKIASAAFANYNVYGESIDSKGNKVWTTNIANFNNTQEEHAEGTMSADEALAAYIAHIAPGTQPTSQEMGEIFREDVLSGFINPLKQQIALIAKDYKFTEESFVDFTKLGDNDVITVKENGDILANFGLNIRIYLHDAIFVENGNDQAGNIVSAYKHSYELYIPLEFRNIKLDRVYKQLTGTTGVSWSIFDNAGARSSDSPSLTVKTTGVMGPYIQELTFDETTEKFKRSLTPDFVGIKDVEFKYADVYKDIKDFLPEKVEEKVKEYMQTKWPLLTVLNILHYDHDGSKANISFGYESKYLSKVKI